MDNLLATIKAEKTHFSFTFFLINILFFPLKFAFI